MLEEVKLEKTNLMKDLKAKEQRIVALAMSNKHLSRLMEAVDKEHKKQLSKFEDRHKYSQSGSV